jgi:Grx4 family monothiol glutaredoxin
MSESHLQSINKLELDAKPISIINFYANWAAQCKDMNKAFDELSKKYPSISFVKLEAESYPEFSEEHAIAAVPTFIIFKHGKAHDRIEGANVPLLNSTVEKYAKESVSAAKYVPPKTSALNGHSEAASSLNHDALNKKLQELVNSYPVMLFIKGTPQQPRCGFSSQIVEILNSLKVAYGSYNILANEQIRQGMKKFSNWPTFPQLYIKGEFIGGLDIVKEMVETKELQALLPTEESLEERLKKLINKAPIMLFMKGDPTSPKCGFSREIVDLFNEQGVTFDTFDVLGDEEVRQGLKKFSKWPTYPQVYLKGELMGGLDIVKEMISNGDFKTALSA